MFSMHAYVLLVTSLTFIHHSQAITSPLSTFTNYTHSTELQTNVADLWWTVDEENQVITFELHIQTTGWIALGISPAGGMTGADIGVGWVDAAGALHFQDRYAPGYVTPVIDNTTTDWFGLQGREENGWTAIQFKRPLDSCDPLDVPIKSGTNILIFAYGVTDPEGDITYHENRKNSRVIPLRSYDDPPPESKFEGLDYFDFRLNNYVVPSDGTTYHCKVYRVPKNLTERRHAIAQQVLLNSSNTDIVHHLLMYECPSIPLFNDDNLPEGLCDDIGSVIGPCMVNIATGWAVGGDAMIEYPETVGYALGGNAEVTHFVIQMHYDNPKRYQNRTDSTGMRFYLGEQLRQNDLGFLTFGTDATFKALAIPPTVERFVVDAYCTANATQSIPEEGITVFSALPHTHLQGRTVWTKIIRNQTAVQYLFNADSFDFNYQFINQLTPVVKLYPGDELATRCIYNTMNKNVTTLGGEGTREEMCLHSFMYYPRVNTLAICLGRQSDEAWRSVMNSSSASYATVEAWLKNLTWTTESKQQWQEFYNTASRTVGYGRTMNYQEIFLPQLPEYNDLPPTQCHRIVEETSTTTVTQGPATASLYTENPDQSRGFCVKRQPFLSVILMSFITVMFF